MALPASGTDRPSSGEAVRTISPGRQLLIGRKQRSGLLIYEKSASASGHQSLNYRLPKEDSFFKKTMLKGSSALVNHSCPLIDIFNELIWLF